MRKDGHRREREQLSERAWCHPGMTNSLEAGGQAEAEERRKGWRQWVRSQED